MSTAVGEIVVQATHKAKSGHAPAADKPTKHAHFDSNDTLSGEDLTADKLRRTSTTILGSEMGASTHRSELHEVPDVKPSNPFEPPTLVKLTLEQQKAMADRLTKRTWGGADEKPEPKYGPLDGIYRRIATNRQRKESQELKLTRTKQERMAQRLYYQTLNQKEQSYEATRQKYKPPVAPSTYIDAGGVENMLLRLYPPPGQPSLLSQASMYEEQESTHWSPSSCSKTRSPEYATSDSEDEGSPEKSSLDASDRMQSRPGKGTARILTTKHSTILSLVRQQRRQQRVEPPELMNYSADADPHLFWYWKSRKKHQKELRKRAKEEHKLKQKEAALRAERHRANYRPAPIHSFHEKEKLRKAEAHQRIMLRMQENDARRTLRNTALRERQRVEQGLPVEEEGQDVEDALGAADNSDAASTPQHPRSLKAGDTDNKDQAEKADSDDDDSDSQSSASSRSSRSSGSASSSSSSTTSDSDASSQSSDASSQASDSG
mmetsp:Transcript_104531/g.180104  ORF Transcript_104531/g.180104 Transcript_104531/m.180104 type:complete len:491 (-) Transcript_104531:1428-2900(-)